MPTAFQPDILMRPNRYIWLGTDKLFDAFTFDFRKTEHGWFQAHIYKFDDGASTFIVETTEEAFLAHGLDKIDQDGSIAFCEKLFSEILEGPFTRHQCASSARLGMAVVPAPDLRQVDHVQRQQPRRADGRRRPYRAFRHRLRHQAGAGRCDRTDAISSSSTAHRGRLFRRCLRPMRNCAGSMSRASRTPRATRWNGSRWSARAMPIRWSRSSSCIRC